MNTGSNKKLILPENNKIYVDDLYWNFQSKPKVLNYTEQCDTWQKIATIIKIAAWCWWWWYCDHHRHYVLAQWVTQASPGKVKHVTLQVAPPPLSALSYSLFILLPHIIVRLASTQRRMVVAWFGVPKVPTILLRSTLKVFFVSSCQSERVKMERVNIVIMRRGVMLGLLLILRKAG